MSVSENTCLDLVSFLPTHCLSVCLSLISLFVFKTLQFLWRPRLCFPTSTLNFFMWLKRPVTHTFAHARCYQCETVLNGELLDLDNMWCVCDWCVLPCLERVSCEMFVCDVLPSADWSQLLHSHISSAHVVVFKLQWKRLHWWKHHDTKRRYSAHVCTCRQRPSEWDSPPGFSLNDTQQFKHNHQIIKHEPIILNTWNCLIAFP